MTSAGVRVVRWMGRIVRALIHDLAGSGEPAHERTPASHPEASKAQSDDVMDAMLDEDGIDTTGL